MCNFLKKVNLIIELNQLLIIIFFIKMRYLLGFNHDLKCCRLLEKVDTIFYVESWLVDLSTNFLEYHWNIGIYQFFFTNFLVSQRPVNALSPSTNSGQRVSSPFKFHVVGVGGIGEPMPKGLGSSLVIIGPSFHSFNICW